MGKYSKFKGQVVTPHVRDVAQSETPGTTAVEVLAKDSSGKVIFASGVTVPTDTETGFAKGCIFIDTDVAGGTSGTYINVGTNTSCNFDLVPAGTGATTFLALTDTPANYVGAGDKLVKVNTGATALEFVSVSGDAAMSLTGVFTVTDLTITAEAQGDLLRREAANWARLAAKTAGQVVMGDGTDVVSLAISGDGALSGAGVLTITDLTIAGEAQGDILYRNATNWVRLAAGVAGQSLLTNGAGANPSWGSPTLAGATSLSNNCTLNDAGGFDAVLVFTQQTVGSPNLTIPDLANVDDTFVFVNLAQTLVNKTLTSPVLTTPQINDTSADHQYIFAVNELAADRTITLPLLLGNDTFVFADFIQTLTNKTLTSPVLTTPQINDTSADHQYIFAVNELAADRTVTLPLLLGNDVFVFADHIQTLTGKTLTLNVATSFLFSAGGNTIQFQNAIHTVIGRDTTDTLTNKSFDCDGAGNALTNVNAQELDSVAGTHATYGIPITLFVVNTGAATLNIFNVNAPFKFRVTDVSAVNTKAANNGNWKLDNGAADITTAVAYGAGDTSLTRGAAINDATHTIAANGSLRLINSDATDTAIVYVTIARVD